VTLKLVVLSVLTLLALVLLNGGVPRLAETLPSPRQPLIYQMVSIAALVIWSIGILRLLNRRW